MSEKYYPQHTTGENDDLLVTMTAHHVSFKIHYFGGKVFLDIGPSCGLQLSIEQAQALRNLLDLGIADALDASAAREAAAGRVDLVKAVA